jgi:hypothetical protein
MKVEYVYELSKLKREDNGAALIAEYVTELEQGDDCMWVKLQSWDETKRHRTLRAMEGKRVRITVEVVE